MKKTTLMKLYSIVYLFKDVKVFTITVKELCEKFKNSNIKIL